MLGGRSWLTEHPILGEPPFLAAALPVPASHHAPEAAFLACIPSPPSPPSVDPLAVNDRWSSHTFYPAGPLPSQQVNGPLTSHPCLPLHVSLPVSLVSSLCSHLPLTTPHCFFTAQQSLFPASKGPDIKNEKEPFLILSREVQCTGQSYKCIPEGCLAVAWLWSTRQPGLFL